MKFGGFAKCNFSDKNYTGLNTTICLRFNKVKKNNGAGLPGRCQEIPAPRFPENCQVSPAPAVISDYFPFGKIRRAVLNLRTPAMSALKLQLFAEINIFDFFMILR